MSILPPRDGGDSINLWIANWKADYTCWNQAQLHVIHPIVVPVNAMDWLFKASPLDACTKLTYVSLKTMLCFLNPTPCAADGVIQTGISPSAVSFRNAKQGANGELHFTWFLHLWEIPVTTKENSATKIKLADTYVLKHSRIAPRPKG